ncbi:dipeptidase [Buchananella hordeovulneris]|uniref:dipeptidase n=1 Tax=Buchananella hordeovulneris TaxID=52770 RepID=UPI000F5E226F|nr:dipeptidase [Buchananella hordeovulneris]RRD51622.1 dipeptidase [Buchananella hordeovulneris]
MTESPTVAALLAAVDARFEQALQDLEDFIRIPSVSSASFDQSTLEDSARFVAERLTEIGLQAHITRGSNPDGTPGRPAVIATSPTVAGAPTVLLYAHHDVQPGGEAEDWSTPGPFVPVRRDGRLYGRGSADDGAGIIAHLGALRALRDVFGPELPLGVAVFIEGEEESGSPSFANFLTAHQAELAADVIVVADSANWTTTTPALTTSLRGVVDCQVELRVTDGALHSGMFGGPILDAVTLMARLIATLHDENGDVAIAGLVARDDAEVDYAEETFRADAGLRDGVQLAGTGDLAARLWTKPAVSVIGLDATSVANASNTIAPACRAAISLRVAPGQDTAAAMDALVSHLQNHAPFGAEVTVTPGDLGPAFAADVSGAAASAKRWALERAYGEAPVGIGMGGSIPFISTFRDTYPQAEILVTGVEDPHSKAHSEDESLDIESLRKIVGAQALFLARLAGQI